MWTNYVEEADSYNVRAAAEDLEELEGDLYDAARSSAIDMARDLETEYLEELKVESRRENDKELLKIVSPILRERWMDDVFGK